MSSVILIFIYSVIFLAYPFALVYTVLDCKGGRKLSPSGLGLCLGLFTSQASQVINCKVRLLATEVTGRRELATSLLNLKHIILYLYPKSPDSLRDYNRILYIRMTLHRYSLTLLSVCSISKGKESISFPQDFYLYFLLNDVLREISVNWAPYCMQDK